MSMNPEELAMMQAMMGAGGAIPPEAMMTPPDPEPEYIEVENNLTPEEQREKIFNYDNRFNQAQMGMGDHHKLWKMLDMFDRGKQWDSVSIPVWIPKPVTNLIRYVRTTKRANLASSIPQATFVPMTPDDMDLVNQVQKAYDHVWDEQKVPLMVRKIIDRGLLFGTSIAYVYVEENIRGKYYGEGHRDNQLYRYDVKVKRIGNANFFIDPTAYCLEEAKYITITETLSFKDVKNNPTFRSFAGKKLKDLKYADIQRDSSATGDIYDRDTSKADATEHLTGDEMCTMHIHWERYRNEEGRWQVDCSYYLWNTDFFLYRIEDFKPSVYPFAVYCDEEEDNSFWGTSTAMDMLENQKIINKAAQTASIIGTLQQNPQKVVLRESGINAAEMSRTGTLPGKVWTSNIPNPVEVIQPPEIPRGLFDIEDRMKNDIKDMSGITEAYTGQSVGSLTTSTGVDSLIERSSIRDKDKSIQIDDFVEQLSNIIAQFILVYWQESRPIMTRQKNGQAEFEEWNPVPLDILDNLEWRVRSDVYAKAPVTAATKSQQADNLMQLQGQFQYDPPIITPEEWIELKDFPNKSDILARMEVDRVNKEKQDAMAMQQNILGIIQQSQQMKAQGATDDEVAEAVTPMIDEMIQATFTSGQNQGSAQVMQNAPAGTGPVQAANMLQG